MAKIENKKITNNFQNTFSYKLIYVFGIPDNAHSDCIKIGDTTIDTDLTQDRLQPNCKELNQAALARINQYTKTAAITVQLLHTEIAIRTIQNKDKTWKTESFRDKAVHAVLKNSGFKQKKFGDKNLGVEWFCCTVDEAIKAITAVKHDDKFINNLVSFDKFIPISFRPEQNDAIEKTVRQFKKSPRMLWNAKMRFGKTLCALEVVRQCNFKRTVLITHKPVVDDGWHEDFGKIFTKEDKYCYGSKKSGITIEDLEKSFVNDKKNYIYFASIQDLRGSKIVGGNFNKNDVVFDIDWDCVIIDEAHEGTTTELGDKVKSLLFKEEKGTKLLELSGTPFNILSNYEDDESVFTWDYVMEQRAKQEWEETHFGDSNPYSELPQMKMYTYDLGKLLSTKYQDIEDKAFNFKEFFATDENEEFKHKKEVKGFLDLLCKKDATSLYPFCNQTYIDLFHHTFWMLPGVKEALALQHLLEEHPVFCNFKIVNVAGDGDPDDPTGEALEAVRSAISAAGDDGYTITLSCGKLTTGVSVKQWTAVFMLYGSYSTKAAGYLQTIFRVQTPCNDYGKSKTCAYVFDFAPDRTLKMVSEAVSLSAKAGKTTVDSKNALGEFLNFCPVIGIDGSQMKEYKVEGLLQQLKRAYAERAVTKGFDDSSLYNDELLKLTNVEIEKFNDLSAIIGSSKANKKNNEIGVNNQGLTEEEYKILEGAKSQAEKRELSQEEIARKEKIEQAKKMRQTAISVLRGISVRMPLLIYGADVPIDEEITLTKFINLVDDISWEEFMPRGVTKEKFLEFTKYYDEDVFIAAGKRIRALVLSADSLPITERVKKIAEIFSYFKNPDKETVLTPWRVVNMHMGDCLGGYSFYNADFTQPLEEKEDPHFIDITGVTEKTLGNPEAKILEINSKTGLYPLYCAYSIFRSRRNESMADEKVLWAKTLDENIYVVCKTPMAKAITRRTLCGFNKYPTNCHAFDDLINMLKNKSDQFIQKVTSQNYWNKGNSKMEFNAIVGNPPYQEMDGGNGVSARPVYQLFITIAKKIKPKFISMISPARWYIGGKGLDKFRDEMLNDQRILQIVDYETSTDVFPSVDIAGGVSYFLWSKDQLGLCNVVNVINGKRDCKSRNLNLYPVFIRRNNSLEIIEKVKLLHKGNYLSEYVSARKPFGIPTNYQPKENGVPCYFIQKIGKKYAKETDIIDSSHLLDKWKLLVPKAPIAGQTDFTKPVGFYYDGNTRIAEPGSCCTESFIVAGAFKTKEEIISFKTYLFTKVVRFLLLQCVISQDITRQNFIFVPALQKYEGIYTDKMLCSLWGINAAEWEYIDSRIHNYEKR